MVAVYIIIMTSVLCAVTARDPSFHAGGQAGATGLLSNEQLKATLTSKNYALNEEHNALESIVNEIGALLAAGADQATGSGGNKASGGNKVIKMADGSEVSMLPTAYKARGCMKKLIEDGNTSCCAGPIGGLTAIRKPDWTKAKYQPSKTEDQKLAMYQQFALRQYSGEDYKTINPLLRAYPNEPAVKVIGGQYYTFKGTMTDFTRGAIFVACVAKGLAENGGDANNMTVYRASGKNVPEGVIKKWTTVGGTFSDNGFFSTSRGKAYYLCEDPLFKPDVRFQLTTAANSRCKDMGDYSAHKNEKEVLCSPGTKWKVTFKKNEDDRACGKKVTTVHAEEESSSG